MDKVPGLKEPAESPISGRKRSLRIHLLTLIASQSGFGDKTLGISGIGPQNRTGVLKAFRSIVCLPEGLAGSFTEEPLFSPGPRTNASRVVGLPQAKPPPLLHETGEKCLARSLLRLQSRFGGQTT